MGHHGDVATDAPRSRRQRALGWLRTSSGLDRVVLGAAVLLVVLLVVSVAALFTGGPTTLRGSFVLAAYDRAFPSACPGRSGFSDLRAGAPVVVRDGSGEVLGEGVLAGERDLTPFGCAWEFEVDDVPTDRDSYAVEVGNRDPVLYTRDQLGADDFEVELADGR